MNTSKKVSAKSILLSALFLGQLFTAGAQQVKFGDKIISVNGNTFTFGNNQFADTQIIIDPITGSNAEKIVMLNAPVSINDKKVYSATELSGNRDLIPPATSVAEYLVNIVKAEKMLTTFVDGNVYVKINNVVINEKGHLVFYESPSVTFIGNEEKTPRNLSSPLHEDKTNVLANAPALKPATIKGKPVAVAYNKVSMPSGYVIRIKNHVVTYEKEG